MSYSVNTLKNNLKNVEDKIKELIKELDNIIKNIPEDVDITTEEGSELYYLRFRANILKSTLESLV